MILVRNDIVSAAAAGSHSHRERERTEIAASVQHQLP
jgi:hypothetical protein